MLNPIPPLRQRGFTLVELMVAVVIVGILGAVAYPSYIQHVVKSNRAAAQAHLLDLAQREQQYLADNRSYAASVSALNLTTPDAVSSKYSILIEVQDGPPPSFTITATPLTNGPQASDGALTINNAGTKSPASKW
ncbi:type 4a pilus minor pilin PilE [Pseudoduganella ginsengisoli]|uniref:Prepilin-type N-terminal cleavage/methylation domain-containing protein n=1 Tax=Pseudoduganella ginsengisoli TaxID=1462440 RepID=A0A6L6Q7F5_9BURK|nr:type IV pilin protein [Pseudoduganella ginsengisoli]MTW05763.1 prepilin-type N-terminal cleavage/methylation domain-containing protein [Pseudoduganella ginsengisoli]